MNRFLFLLSGLLVGLINLQALGTDANIFGDVQSNGEHIPFVSIHIEGSNAGTTTDHTGHYMLIDLTPGKQTIVAKAIGYKEKKIEIELEAGKTVEVNFELEEEVMSINEIVVTGTKTYKRSTESAVIVNLIDSKMLEAVQANALSEGLCFQPGLRVETNCQTCGYSQLRMNGLGGSYSQILINSRPVFSPLTGLYGLEQIPANMIDRIEVVRGGGSALYGSSAIGGTVNVITKTPRENTYNASITHSLINGESNDNVMNGNVTVLSKKRNAGMSFFGSRREREFYDHNNDNYSEIPTIQNNSYGLMLFFKPKPTHKLELNMSSMYEYRYGGEMVEASTPAYKAEQSEERRHDVLMGGADYEIMFNNYKSSFVMFAAGQRTLRTHYTGAIPEVEEGDSTDFIDHFFNPPYGHTINNTYQGGAQLNHTLGDFPGGEHIITAGLEYKYDDILDRIPAYERPDTAFTDQVTKEFGSYLQSDWNIFEGFNLLTGVRADKHNFVDNIIFNPRVSALYKMGNAQFRASWATGFRAPQAFDSDLHIEFAGGGISRVVLSSDLKEERSQSWSTSFNYDKPTENYIFGFTVEGFYTKLNNAFVSVEKGEDDYGIVYEKVNGSGSTVQGLTLEARANYDRKVQLEGGFTLQSSMFDEAVEYSSLLEPTKDYLRTPDNYGYLTLTYTPTTKITAAISNVYTGEMKLLHVPGDEINGRADSYRTSPSFFETGVKVSYLFNLPTVDSGIELFGGVKNVFNEYQNDFDIGKNRDSNYIYGPALPRTFYLGIKLRSL